MSFQSGAHNFSLYAHKSAELIAESAKHLPSDRINSAIALLSNTVRQNSVILTCGNGGSASDAMHITGELVGRFLKERRAIKAICLSSNPSVLTAWANDYSFETAFSRQIEAYAEPGGVLIGLSTSGNSQNVMHAFKRARQLSLSTIAFTGMGGGKLASLADVLLDVPSKSTPLIQQVHICFYHYLCEQVELESFT